METWLLVFGLAIGAILFIGGKMGVKKEEAFDMPILNAGEDAASKYATPNNAQGWWNALPLLDELQLALALAKKTMPIWQNYVQNAAVNYKDSANGPSKKINSQLLDNALKILDANSNVGFPTNESAEIRNCYNDFVEPIIAMQDGLWSPPYPVKKVFLSMYYILRSIIEENAMTDKHDYLSTAIANAFDSLDMTKLYPADEMEAFITSYKPIVG